MCCYFPNKAVKLFKNEIPVSPAFKPKNGVVLVGRFCKQIELVNKTTGIIRIVREPDMLKLPCGQCMGCRIRESVDRANRCILETMHHDENWFITLTYDDEHLPFSSDGVATLNYRDIVNFNKNLRRQLEYHYGFKEPLKFMYAGEYGEKQGCNRPHYHGIYCNLPLPNLIKFGVNHQGDIVYRSPFLEKIWKKGFVTVGRADWQSCAYVARYVCKKHKGKDKGWYEANGVTPEKCVMSKGFAKISYDVDLVTEDIKYIVPDRKKGFREVPCPRIFAEWWKKDKLAPFESLRIASESLPYYDTLARAKENLYEQAKEKVLSPLVQLRAKKAYEANEAFKEEMSKTDVYDMYDYLRIKYDTFLQRVGALKRGMLNKGG